MTTTRPTVASLRIQCDLASAGLDESPGDASFLVSEFAVLSDGREIPLVANLGWTAWPSAEYWTTLTTTALEREIGNVLLPDDAEHSGETQDWAAHARRLNELGVPATPATLKQVPRHIDVAQRLLRKLRPALSAPCRPPRTSPPQ